jgi:predicted DNA-binding ribbon-helix-helix protein
MARSVRNIDIASHRTSFRLEQQFWDGMTHCAKERGMTIHELATEVVSQHRGSEATMTSAIRVFLIGYFQNFAMMVQEPTKQIRSNMELFGRRTSFSLEAGVWNALTEMSRKHEQSIDEVCETIISNAEPGVSMASAIRISVLLHFMERSKST